MKKLILTSLFLLSPFIYSQQPTSFEIQEKYEVTEGTNAVQGVYNSINKYVVVETGMSEKDMYDKTINWLNESYNDPDEVFLGKVEGEYIRFKGSPNNTPLIYIYGNLPVPNVIYHIEVRFREGRFKFEILKIEYWHESYSRYSKSVWIEKSWDERIQNRKGKDDTAGLNTLFAKQKYFNSLLENYTNYLTSDTKSDDDDW